VPFESAASPATTPNVIVAASGAAGWGLPVA
jgi:hypothetical protein